MCVSFYDEPTCMGICLYLRAALTNSFYGNMIKFAEELNVVYCPRSDNQNFKLMLLEKCFSLLFSAAV